MAQQNPLFTQSAENQMIDFRIKSADEKVGGLNLGFCAGRYLGKDSRRKGVYVTEDAFAFLEPSIAVRWPTYCNFGHWGVTAINRESWQLIIEDWQNLGRIAEDAKAPEAICRAVTIPMEVAHEVRANFQDCRQGVASMMRTLIPLLREMLESEDEVCVMGI
ncbi:MAG TPA: hypothetical protein VIJ79_13850 [Acidobacteriaceae bacterium]